MRDQLLNTVTRTLVMEGGGRAARIPFKPGGYRNLKRVLRNNFYYIGNLIALRQWYRYIRYQFIGPEFPGELYEGLIATLDKGIGERTSQLGALKEKIVGEGANKGGVGQAFCSRWSQIRDLLDDNRSLEGSANSRNDFSEIITGKIRAEGRNYCQVIKSLSREQAVVGSSWLQDIVDQVNDQISSILEL